MFVKKTPFGVFQIVPPERDTHISKPLSRGFGIVGKYRGGAFKTDIEPPTKRLSQNGMTLKEYLDQEDEVLEEIRQV